MDSIHTTSQHGGTGLKSVSSDGCYPYTHDVLGSRTIKVFIGCYHTQCSLEAALISWRLMINECLKLIKTEEDRPLMGAAQHDVFILKT